MEEPKSCNISSHIFSDILPKPELEPETKLCHQSLFSSSVYIKLLPYMHNPQGHNYIQKDALP